MEDNRENLSVINNSINLLKEIVEESCFDFKIGGPFGAIVIKNGKIVGTGVNRVIGKHDPTAHAEIEAIRQACINLKTHDLTGCEIYATGYPCPMCMSAIIWANIKKVYYSASYWDAEVIGFRDQHIFDFLQGKNSILEFEQVDKNSIIELYERFKNTRGEIY